MAYYGTTGLPNYIPPRSSLFPGLADALASIPLAPAAAPDDQSTWVGGGIRAGLNELGATGGQFASAIGRVAGLSGLEQWGQQVAEARKNAAEAIRPDLQTPPWHENGSPAIPWAIHLAARQIPNVAAMVLGGAGVSALAARAGLAMPAALVAAGERVPAWLGGGPGFAGQMAATTTAGYPLAVGSLFGEVAEKEKATGERATPGEVASVFAKAVPYAALEAFDPQILRGLARPAGEAAIKTISRAGAARIGKAALVDAAAQIPQEGLQTALEQSYRTDLPASQKAQHIVDAALSGAVVGGLFGGAAGTVSSIRSSSRVDPTALANNPDAMAGAVDQALGIQGELPLETPVQPVARKDEAAAAAANAEVPGQGELALGLANEQPGTPLLPAQPPQSDVGAVGSASSPGATAEAGQTAAVSSPEALFARQVLDRAEAAGDTQMAEWARTRLDELTSNQPAAASSPELMQARQVLDRAEATGNTQMAEWARVRLNALTSDEAVNPDAFAAARKNAGLVPAVEAEAATATGSAGEPSGNPAADAAFARQVLDRAEAAGDTQMAEWARARLAEPYVAADRFVELMGKNTAQNRARALSSKVQDDADILNVALDNWNKQRPSAWAVNTLKSLGFLDAAGNATDLTSLRNDIAQLTERSQHPALAANPEMQAMVTQRLNQLTQLERTISTAEQRRTGSPATAEVQPQDTTVADAPVVVGAQPAATPSGGSDVSQMKSLPGTPQTTLSDTAFTRVFDRTIKKIGENRRDAVNVVKSVNDLPPEVRQSAESGGESLEGAKAAIYRGQVYLVKDNIHSEADLQEAMFHEVLGHGGVQARYGRSAPDAMFRFFQLAGGVDGILKLGKRFGVEQQLKAYIPEREMNAKEQGRLFDELLAQVAGKHTGRMSSALMAWAGEIKSAFIKLANSLGFKEFGNKVGSMSPVDVAAIVRRMRRAVDQGGSLYGQEVSFQRATPPQVEQKVFEAATLADQIGKRVDASGKIGEMQRYFGSLWDLSKNWGHLFKKGGGPDSPSLVTDVFNAESRATVIKQMFDRLGVRTVEDINTLANSRREGDRRAAALINELMKASALRIDPTKGPDEHTWLQGERNWSELRRMIVEQNLNLRRLTQMQKVGYYTNARHLNEAQLYSSLSVNLRNWIMTDPVLREKMPAFGVNPMDRFRSEPELHETAAGARNYWRSVVEQQMANAQSILGAETATAMKLDGKERADVLKAVEPLDVYLKNMARSIANNDLFPYFHLGRTGNWFLAFDVKGLVDANGKVVGSDPAAVAKLTDALRAAGMDNVELTWASDKPGAYIRVKTSSEAARLRQLLESQQQAGNVAKNSIFVGERDDAAVTDRTMTQMMQRYIEHISNSDTYEAYEGATEAEIKELAAARQRTIQSLREWLLNSLPDSNVNKVFAHRAGVKGYDANMMQSYAHRIQLGSSAIASISEAPARAQAMREMRAMIKEAGSQGETQRSVKDIRDMHGVLTELTRRQLPLVDSAGDSIPEKIRAVNHGWFSMLSPAYSMIQMVSIPQFLLPELGKRYGYAQSALAIAKVTPLAFRILKAAFSEGKSRSWSHAADGTITQAVLQRAGVSKADAKFLMSTIGRGDIEVGSQARELGRLANGEVGARLTNTLRYASAMSYYAETFARLVSALSAKELHGNKPNQAEYVADIIRGSQMTFSSFNNSRFLDRQHGFVGRLTPIATSFLSWQTQATTKLYREMAVALGAMSGNQKEAIRFLGGHAAAMTVLAGSLGLPFASVAAHAVDKLVDLFSPEGEPPYDVQAAWRNFLADTFGKDLGEVLARGLPRAAGVDISRRVGEQDIIPFSRFLTSRQKAKEAASDLVVRAAGSPVSAAINILDGVEDAFNGKLTQGFAKMLPIAFRNLLNAYRMTDEGYTDSRGNKLPLTPGAMDILIQAIGFNPGARAEYMEAAQTQRQRQQGLRDVASSIRQQFVDAAQTGDTADMRDALRRASLYSARNPAYNMLPGLASSLQSNLVAGQLSKALGLPLGGNLKDVEGNRNLRYANF